ncbi:MAG: hypothetical protein B7Z55_18205, partial [Planctomycetales bacterium 12-60-4]
RLAVKGSGRIGRSSVGISFGGSLSAEASGLAPRDPALAEALGRDVTGSLRLRMQEGSGALRLSDIRLAGAGLAASGALQIEGLDKAFLTSGRLVVEAADLTRFSRLAGRSLGGAGRLEVTGSASGLSGFFDSEVAFAGTDLAMGQPEVDRLLAGPSRLKASIRRDETGTALRAFGKSKNAQGHWQLTLNNKSIFQWGPLDQGWWPDGLLTPPSDAAMRSDIEFLKACGFNMIRKHIKVEPRRYYHHCDTLGMIMWQDQVSNGYGKNRNEQSTSPAWTRMAPNPVDAQWPDDAHQQWVLEYKRMVEHLRDAPCIGVWIPFNEAWGQHATMEVGKMAAELDSTRLINIASGG